MTEQERPPVEDERETDDQDVEGHDFMTEEVARQRVRDTAREAERHRNTEAPKGKGKSLLDRLTGR